MSILTGDDANVEFRSTRDDAWYNCIVVLQHGNQLRVKFENFEQTSDEVFSVSDFSTSDEIAEFLRRFRPISEAINDNECSKIVPGMVVCAEYTGDNQLRYFDAVIDAVNFKEHTPKKCSCTYLLCWQHGPEKGNLTIADFDDIYFIRSGALAPTIQKFTRFVKDKVERPPFVFTLIPKNPLLPLITTSTETVTKPQEFGSASHSSHNGFSAEPELNDEDKDLGGVKETDRTHYIILENLEKDLCPLSVTDFLHEQTSITAQACIFPSLLNDTNARGAILVNSLTKLKRIYEFIKNPNHIIVSISGRPWVIAEDKFRTGTFIPNLLNVQTKYEGFRTKQNLKVVRLGSKEYQKAKRLKDMYVQFGDHINLLVQRLATEEEKANDESFSAE